MQQERYQEQMDREVLFGKALERVKEKAKEQNHCISEEQVQEIFGELALSDEQMEMVYQYLRQHKIGIGEPPDADEYLQDEDRDYLEEYLKELTGLPALSEGEKEAVTLSAMAGDGDAQRKLIEVYLPEVAELAKLYAGQGVYLEDLIGEGNVALTMGVTMLGALEHASEAQGMLGKLIMDAMEDFITENADEQKKNKHIADKVNKVADAANELSEELHREITVDELVAETNLSRKAVEDAVRISGGKIETIANSREA
jgi:RNA polymerase primary sigma factor